MKRKKTAARIEKEPPTGSVENPAVREAGDTAIWGDACMKSATLIVKAFSQVLLGAEWWAKHCVDPKKAEAEIDRRWQQISRILLGKLERAIVNGKGDFFRHLAHAAEKIQNPKNPVLDKTVEYHVLHSRPPRTQKEIQAWIEERLGKRVKIDQSQLSKRIKKLGTPWKRR